ncbi:hypothetical protein JXO52_02840 [bacterium]|nr:hypothetical protein [bacterium]
MNPEHAAFESKLKPVNPHMVWYGILWGAAALAFFIFIWACYGESTVDTAAGTLMGLGALVALITFIRTRNAGFLVFLLWQGLMSARLLFQWTDPVLVTGYRIVILPVVALYFYLIFAKKTGWKYRNVLELAARPVTGVQDGFTGRPRPAGNARFTPEAIRGFGNYLAKHLIAFPYRTDTGTALVLSRSELMDMMFLRRNFDRDSYVFFADDGSVSVHIAKPEYEKYREEYTFSELCDSLAALFLRFLDLYVDGRQQEIVRIVNHKE